MYIKQKMGREPGTFGYVHDDILYVWCMSLCIVSGNQIIVHAVCPNHAGDSSYVGCYPTLSVTGLANIKKMVKLLHLSVHAIST